MTLNKEIKPNHQYIILNYVTRRHIDKSYYSNSTPNQVLTTYIKVTSIQNGSMNQNLKFHNQHDERIV